MHRTRFLLPVFLIAVLAAPALVAAQSYPTKPLRLIAPFPTGASQILAHLLSERLNESLGQPVVVDYRPGGGGNIGAEVAAKTPPDGYTLVILSASHATSPSMYKTLRYDVVRDFSPISLVAAVPNVLVIHPSLPASSLKGLAALGRSHPGKLTFGSGGVGASNHLASELFASLAKVSMVHVPYKGASIALNNILSGEVDMVCVTVPATIPFITSGRLRGLAVLDKTRVKNLPGVPTSAEAGFPDLVMITWYGVAAPAGLRPELVERLNKDLVAAMHNPDIKQKLEKVGIDAVGTPSAEFAEFLRTEVSRWAKVIRDAKIQVE
jgi:tripartite-type tricarboxylate transporter receptor subunit TctC